MKYLLFLVFIFICQNSFSQALFDTLVKIPHTTIKDQQMSGTCWSFGTTSFIESELIRQGEHDYDLSEMYFAYHNLKAKTQMHVRMQGNNFFTAGGQMHDVMNVVQQFGLMPESAYGGYTTRNLGHNHSLLDTALTSYMREIAARQYPSLPAQWPRVVDSILSTHLGTPPQAFSFNEKSWSAAEFRDSLGIHADDYITLTSYNHHPYYTWFVLEDRYNWANGLYYNLPPDVFESVCDSALMKGYSFVWDGDVSEKTFNAEAGTAIMKVELGSDIKALRQNMFDNHQTTVDHVMHVVGKLKKYNGEQYFMLKNSWGLYGRNKGYILMNRDYFILKTVAVMLNKQALPKEIQMKIQD